MAALLFLLANAASSVVADGLRKDFYFSKEVYSDETDASYRPFRNILGKDVIIFGNDVSIDEPILTNGGNIIIFANSVSINAPIDTRIYLTHPNRYNSGRFGLTNILKESKNEPLMRFFDSYYFTDFGWDPGKKLSLSEPIKADRDGNRTMPRLPQGAMVSYRRELP
jgi:hypothetical protein